MIRYRENYFIYSLIFIMATLSVIQFIGLDHYRAPDHFTYYTYISHEYSLIGSYHRYWSLIIEFFKRLGMSTTTPFYFGVFAYYISGLLLIRVFKLEEAKALLFSLLYVFDYSFLCSFTIDKSAVTLLLLSTLHYLLLYRKPKTLTYMLMVCCIFLILLLRAWLIAPILFFFVLNSRRKIFFMATLIIVLPIYQLRLDLSQIVLIIVKTIFAFPFTYLDPLPKTSDKFFSGGIYGFLVVSWVIKLIFCWIFLKTASAIIEMREINLLLTLMFTCYIISIFSLYFSYDEGSYSYASDAVRRLLAMSQYFTALLVSVCYERRKLTVCTNFIFQPNKNIEKV